MSAEPQFLSFKGLKQYTPEQGWGQVNDLLQAHRDNSYPPTPANEPKAIPDNVPTLTDVPEPNEDPSSSLFDPLMNELFEQLRIAPTDELQRLLARAQRENRCLLVGVVDLDDFKTVNDTLGHAAGDEVLRQIGPRLRGALRPSRRMVRSKRSRGRPDLRRTVQAALAAALPAAAARSIAEALHNLRAAPMDGARLIADGVAARQREAFAHAGVPMPA